MDWPDFLWLLMFLRHDEGRSLEQAPGGNTKYNRGTVTSGPMEWTQSEANGIALTIEQAALQEQLMLLATDKARFARMMKSSHYTTMVHQLTEAYQASDCDDPPDLCDAAPESSDEESACREPRGVTHALWKTARMSVCLELPEWSGADDERKKKAAPRC